MCQIKHREYGCGHVIQQLISTQSSCDYAPCLVQSVDSKINNHSCWECREAESRHKEAEKRQRHNEREHERRGRDHIHHRSREEPSVFPPGHDAFGGQPGSGRREEEKFRAAQLVAYRAVQDKEHARSSRHMDHKEYKKALEEYRWYKQRENNFYQDEEEKTRKLAKRTKKWQKKVAKDFKG